MSDAPLKVVVLGPAGDAQQQLRFALDELGAQTLAVGNFNQLDPASMRALNPDVWLVSMDENTDPALLEPWQPLFDDPNDTVVFDDADVTRRLSGWDLARWARHLAAKVLGREELLLPPVSPDAKRLPQAGEAVNPAAGEGAEVATPQASSGGDASGPFELSLADDATPDGNADTSRVQAHSVDLQSFDTSGLVLVDDDATSASADAPARPAPVDIHSASFEADDAGVLSLADDADLAALSASFEAGRAVGDQREAQPAMSLDDLLRAQPSDADAPTAATGDTTPKSEAAPQAVGGLSGLSLLDLESDHSAPSAAPAAPKSAADISISGLSLSPMDDAEPAKPAGKPAAKAVNIPDTLSGLSLAPIDDGSTAASEGVKVSVKTRELPAVRQAEGLIAVVAGLGGPDAVRQFLGALPDNLPVPVLLWQHLDAGKHDRLAQQMEKATRLPVYLARAGETAHPGEVGVVSGGLQIGKQDGLRFAPGNGGATQGLAATLNDAATVLVVLSGAEAAIVEPAKTHAALGGKVLVQTPMTCFDATAASALDGSGAIVALPVELAAHAAARWIS